MESDEYIEQLISLSINEKIKQHSNEDVVTTEQLIREVAESSQYTEEQVREALGLIIKYLDEQRSKDPEGFDRYIKEKYNLILVRNDT